MNLQKDAECQLPQIDVKEGRMIKMVDHNCMRHWVFRYKLVATLVHLRLLFIQQIPIYVLVTLNVVCGL